VTPSAIESDAGSSSGVPRTPAEAGVAPSGAALSGEAAAPSDLGSSFFQSAPPSVPDRIHTARTAVDLEPPPSRSWSTIAIGAAVFLGVVLVVKTITERVLDPGAVVAVDAGSAVVLDAGSTPVLDAGSAPVLDAGGAVAAPVVVDAGASPVLADAGAALAAHVDAGATPPSAPVDSGVAEDPEARYAGHLKAADVAGRAGAFAKAVREYKAALAIKPTSAVAHLGLGNAYYELDALDAARAHLDKARGLAPKDPQVFLLLGMVHQSAARKDDAIAAYQRYLELAPNGKFARDVQSTLKGLQGP